ncbi:sigma-54-dependent transcriptional regulator [Megalodesulfovibrio gigas]|uniref:Putative response regulator with CheY-like receiver, AAA-type ATPase and DNA-binding domains n=1 Tax=Megalodesulfovibrio gigas (strain ATCC 19364 / DSM 1382 / NCIMB 9332 / VKM B-1759) TaxID=1121448 RepID=T2GFW3_MEGG1|nr:sigma-54 dependent transcriptional regulator [Megalodesulfovibrio gigas]AGW15046.1 putative response regulator with CheY-like receiver, AAA-type ATPase and DNA-binding domains [Megalodesulfovibrio gigas DSM 1382 = ATCC 19364]
MARILIVDDDEITSMALAQVMREEGHTVHTEFVLESGLARAAAVPVDIVFLDVLLPDGNGLEWLPRFMALPSSPLMIIITTAGDPNGAELAIRNGAWNYLQKPCSAQMVQLSLRQALAYREKALAPQPVERGLIVGSSPQLAKCIKEMSLAASSHVNVLVYGETGVGKDLFVRALHQNSTVLNGPFITVDCSALHPAIAVSELFGHKKGSFTSAVSTNQGLVQQAHGGTLFLDEISELDLETQKLLLRVLETRQFRPLGEHREAQSDFRCVCASNKDLAAMVEQGLFRKDLFFRIREATIHLPPLRERLADVPELVAFFLARACTQNKLTMKTVSPDLMRMFCAYSWPGNVRELHHVVRAMVSSAQTDEVIMPWHVPLELRALLIRSTVRGRTPAQAPFPTIAPATTAADANWKTYRAEAMAQVERAYFHGLVEHCHGDFSRMLAVSGLSQAQLYRMLHKHGLAARPKRAAPTPGSSAH